MREQFKQYIISLYHDIPLEIYEGLLSIFFLSLVFLVAWKGFKKCLRYSVSLLLIEYTYLLFCSTVIFRKTGEARRYDFHPFWSYRAIEEGRIELLPENITNVVVFVPIGLLIAACVKGLKWWYALLTGICLSVSIEVLQFVFKKGFSELDDVMHNSLGCTIGFGAYNLIRFGYEKVSKKRMVVL
jgi:glycopeptide antibiotics resistance protein